MSIKSELQRCVADYLRKYLVNHGDWKDLREEEIEQLKAENNRLKKAYSDLEKAYKLTIDAPAPAKPGRKAGSKSKTVVVYCKDCGTYFQAKSKLAKYCSACSKERAKASRAKWLAKQK